MCGVARAVDDAWKEAMSFPKMRQFKQLDMYLSIFGNNVFFDGIKVEVMHKLYKYFQIHQSNHKYRYKSGVVRFITKMLVKLFVVNGGKWGPNFEFSLGRLCAKLKDPKDHSKPNLVLLNYLIPVGRKPIPKIHITTVQGVNHRPSALSSLESHGYLVQLMAFINEAATWTNDTIRWSHIVRRGSDWSVQKVKTFRFHCRNGSFAMRLNDENKCIMKTNNGYVYQFKNAYKLNFLDEEPILLAFGSIWPLRSSIRPNDWVNDKFSSLSSIKHSNRKNCWYLMVNLQEPVFLIHCCVRFEQVQQNLPEPFKSSSVTGFYKKYSFNLHDLMLRKEECQSRAIRNRIILPCGPVFKCRAHNKSRCRDRQCQRGRGYLKYPVSRWKQVWKCNLEEEDSFYVFDLDNGLAMTLMKSVHTDTEYEYNL